MSSGVRSWRFFALHGLLALALPVLLAVAHPAAVGLAQGEFLQGSGANASLASDPPNTVLHFDGVDDIVDVGDISALNGVGQYTIEVWVKFQRFGTWDTVYAKRASQSDRAAVLQVYDESGAIGVAIDDGYYYTDAPLTLGVWYHLAVVYDGAQATDTERLILYIDGAPATLLPYLGSAPVPATTSTTASRFTLGAEYDALEPIDADSAFIVPFKGLVDELRIWNVPRTQQEIQANKDHELGGSESGLEVYFNFNDGVPLGDNTGLTNLSDGAGAAENGTLWNFALQGLSSNYIDESLIKRLYLPSLGQGSE